MRSVVFGLAFAAALAGAAAAAPAEGRAPTVRDIVEMTRLIDPDVYLSAFGPEAVKVSGDGRWFAIATETGDLAAGRNIYVLSVYDTAPALAYVDGKGPRPTPRQVLRTTSADNIEAISQLTWLSDGHTLGFIASVDEAPAQVFAFDPVAGGLRQLTHHPRRVTDFHVIPGVDRVVYVATVPNVNEEWSKTSFPLRNRSVHEVLQQGRDRIQPRYQLYAADTDGNGSPKPLGASFEDLFEPLFRMSPDGRHALALRPFRADPAWATLASGGPGSVPVVTPCGVSGSCARQFVLYDLATGAERPLAGGPVGPLGPWAAGAPGIAWLDAHRVAVANIRMGAAGEGPPADPAILEADVATGETRTVAKLSATGPRITGLRAIGADRIVVTVPQADGAAAQEVTYSRAAGGWSAATVEAHSSTERLRLAFDQDYDRVPEIVGRDLKTGRSRAITDLNPQFRGITFGRQEEFHWRGRDGQDWSGDLILPVGYRPGVRYPLVVQTHGFQPHAFVFEGAAPGPFTAQALAGRGFVVVQMGELHKGGGTHFELTAAQAGIEGIIDTLDARGLIDRSRVGLIGWSYTGMFVDQMMAFSTYPIAAATTADGDSVTLFGYGGQVGRGDGASGLEYYDSLMGDAPPAGEGLKLWLANSAFFHLDRVRTPLLIEQLGGDYLSPAWDTYAVLKRLGKPVDWYIYPRGTHVLVKPLERLASQQLNVDWYSFWLQGYEDPDPAKADQYARWRLMKQQSGKEGR
ncbi:alpha/beta hydrolase family protein [Caulobacter sp. KR2-114]|uniref:alpha/beta hydrolase family protein n=1 Tax=Caulobacter sp. KR2-114 TaxID=3400912 RepID=UPI003C077AA1